MRGNRCLRDASHVWRGLRSHPNNWRHARQFYHGTHIRHSSSWLPSSASPALRLSTSTSATWHRRPDDLAGRRREMSNEEAIDRRYTMDDYMEKTGRDRLPRDHEITDPQIFVMDGGSIEGPLATRFVLTKLNESESLRMIQPYTPAHDGEPAKYAMCKIVNTMDEYRAEKDLREKKKKTAKTKSKEVELSWGISDNDLDTKIRQLAGFLEKGYKVELVLGKKKRGRQVTEEEANILVSRIRAEVETRGGFEAKPPTGDIGRAFRLFIESKGANSG